MMGLTLPQSTATLLHWGESLDPHRVDWRHVATSPSSLGIPVETAEPQTGRDVPTRRTETSGPVVQASERWVGAGIPWPTELYVSKISPEIIINPSARPILTDRVQATLDRLLVLLEREAQRSFVPVSKIEVSGFVDPEEDTEEVVVTQWVKVSTQTALEYWDRLGAAVEVWIDFLPERLAEVAVERIAIEVRWDIDDTTV